MKSAFFCITLILKLAIAGASETLAGISPNKQFAIVSTDSAIHLVALPSRKVVLHDLFDAGRQPSVLWSKDSTRLACSQSLGRFSICRVFQRRDGSFAELALPERTLPFVAAIESHVTNWVGQYDTPSRWYDTSLVITATGTVNLSNETSIDYTYDFTIAFDEQGKGKVTKVQKKRFRPRS